MEHQKLWIRWRRISDASQNAPHIVCLCVAHIAICATNARCATSHKKYAPIRFENSKKIKNRKNQNLFLKIIKIKIM
jgi:hypothetical protein